MVLPFFFPAVVDSMRLRVRKGRRNPAGENVLRLIQIRLATLELEKNLARLSRKKLKPWRDY
jgi:hypothetical protein